jgi:hypothetical protein
MSRPLSKGDVDVRRREGNDGMARSRRHNSASLQGLSLVFNCRHIFSLRLRRHCLGVSNYLRTILEVHCVEVPPFAAPDETVALEGLDYFSRPILARKGF